jgi:hypothetical protein
MQEGIPYCNLIDMDPTPLRGILVHSTKFSHPSHKKQYFISFGVHEQFSSFEECLLANMRFSSVL